MSRCRMGMGGLVLLFWSVLGPAVGVAVAVRENAPPAVSSSEAPMLQTDETRHDFGRITLDGTYEHSFALRNIGFGDLVIEKVTVG